MGLKGSFVKAHRVFSQGHPLIMRHTRARLIPAICLYTFYVGAHDTLTFIWGRLMVYVQPPLIFYQENLPPMATLIGKFFSYPHGQTLQMHAWLPMEHFKVNQNSVWSNLLF